MLQLLDLRRRYANTIALDSMSLEVERGKVVGFLGPNGAGKTTAMRVALGITTPDSGTVLWDHKPVNLSVRSRFGYMPEERGLYSTMTVIDQLEFLGCLHSLEATTARERALYWLNQLGIADAANKRLDALSLGNQQRVQLAATLVHEPELLILDEPFSGLDPTGIESLSNVLRERAAAGCAVVFSSHQLDLVESVCQTVVIVNKGRDVRRGSLDELTETDDRIRVVVRHANSDDWTRQIDGARIITSSGDSHLFNIDTPSVAPVILQAAQSAGEVRHFGYERLRLSEVFRRAVSFEPVSSEPVSSDK